MVLWEITLGTAYFLGLRRTYRLALRIQRKVVSPKHPKIRQFLQRRTRAAFDVALNVHQNIQQRDIEVGRNVGNWILRWLDRMKPSAQIRRPAPPKLPNSTGLDRNMTKHVSSSHPKSPSSIQTSRNQDCSRHLFTASRNMWSKRFPTIAMMTQQTRHAGTITAYRNLCFKGPEMASPNCIGAARGFEGVIRKDIMQYISQNGR